MMGLWHHAAVFHGGKHMKVILHYDAGSGLKDRLEVFKNQGLDISIIPVADVGGFEHALGTCDMLWHVLEPVTADHMAKALHLRLIQKNWRWCEYDRFRGRKITRHRGLQYAQHQHPEGRGTNAVIDVIRIAVGTVYGSANPGWQWLEF